MRQLIRYLLAFMALLSFWELGSRIVGPFLLPSPQDVVARFAATIQLPVFWEHLGSSLWRVLAGMSLAWCTGFPLGLLLGYQRLADSFLAPMIFLTYPLPKIVLLPVFLTLFGLDDLPKIVLIALTTGYQILVVTRGSTQNLDRRYILSFRSLGGTSTQLVRHVLIPAVLPDAITSLRVASGTSVAVLFMAESFATQRGLGFMIMDAWGRNDQEDMFVGILAMSLLGVFLYEICNILERVCCRWKKNSLV